MSASRIEEMKVAVGFRRADGQFGLWHDKLYAGAVSLASAFGLTGEELAALEQLNVDLHRDIKADIAARAMAKRTKKEKNATRRNVEQSARHLARRLKAHPAYTTAIGARLEIIGSENTTDLSAAKPKLKAFPNSHGVVKFTFNKLRSDGVNLYCESEIDGHCVQLARATFSRYNNLALTSDGLRMVVPGRPGEGRIEFWNAQTGKALDRLNKHIFGLELFSLSLFGAWRCPSNAELQRRRRLDRFTVMSRVELAVEKVKHLDENQAEALLEWLQLRESREALRQRLDEEIGLGLKQLKRGEKIPGQQVHAEIRERSRRRRAGNNG